MPYANGAAEEMIPPASVHDLAAAVQASKSDEDPARAKPVADAIRAVTTSVTNLDAALADAQFANVLREVETSVEDLVRVLANAQVAIGEETINRLDKLVDDVRSGRKRSDDRDSAVQAVKESVAALAAHAHGRTMDLGSCRLRAEEVKTLAARRREHGLGWPAPDQLSGIALSGGGIRSATFCLGVLQGLAKTDLLKHFDYLSTVSGGGYIGASLSWWLSDGWKKDTRGWEFRLGKTDFPYGTDGATNVDPANRPEDPEDAGPRLLDYLRKHGNYLAPGEGIDLWSGISVAVRAMFLNLFVLIPLITLVFLLIHWAPRLLFPYLSYTTTFAQSTIAPITVYGTTNPVYWTLSQPICKADNNPLVCIGKVFDNDLGILLRPFSLSFLYILSAAILIMLVLAAMAMLSRGASAIVGIMFFGIVIAVLVSLATPICDMLVDYVAAPFCGSLIEYMGIFEPGTGTLTLVFADAAFISSIVTLAAFIYLLLSIYCEARLPWWLGALPVGGISLLVLLHAPPHPPPTFQRDWSITLAAISAGTYGILCLVYSLISYLVSKVSATDDPSHDHDQAPTVTAVGVRGSYIMRRMFDGWSRVYLLVFAVLLVVGSVPLVADWLRASTEAGAAAALAQNGAAAFRGGSGFAALLAGMVATIAAFMRSRGEFLGFPISAGLIATLAAALLLFGVLVISYQAAVEIRYGEISPMVAFLVLAAAILSGIFVNINNISLGRFYRDRLLETFMPGYESVLQGRTAAAPAEAEQMRLTQISSRAPYHIINTNVVLIGAKDRRRRIRGGDSFILTRDYCGSNATGWCKTKEFMAGEMTLPDAMAISGAAANPNTGVGGVGLTRSRVVSALMALANLRLGYWVPHPTRGKPRAIPNHFHPGLLSFVNGHNEKYWFQELTDGGHFENLGIYELVRRRVRLILVCDAGCDPGFQFEDLQVALRRIEEDFGATIEFCESYKIEDLIPQKVKAAAYPKGLEIAYRGFAVAKIHYASDLGPGGQPRPGARPGWLVYLKSTIVPNLPLDLRGYKGRNPAFPDQATADQFFDEDQFEAYRQLGQKLASDMIEELRLSTEDRDAPRSVEEFIERFAEAIKEKEAEMVKERKALTRFEEIIRHLAEEKLIEGIFRHLAEERRKAMEAGAADDEAA